VGGLGAEERAKVEGGGEALSKKEVASIVRGVYERVDYVYV
jgi:hypothetical protein